MKYFMYSDTARRPSSPNFVHRQFALKKTSDISGRVSVQSVEFVEEAEDGRIKAATVRSSAPVLDPKPAKQSKGGGCTTTPAMKGDGHEHRRLVSVRAGGFERTRTRELPFLLHAQALSLEPASSMSGVVT